MLDARLSSRGVYVSGNSSSTAGLTASVVRDPSGEFALEACTLRIYCHCMVLGLKFMSVYRVIKV